FNVAHSGDWALIAVARGRQVGVDVERIRDDLDMDGIGRLVFTPSECKYLQSLPEQSRLEGFFDLWVRKEAYLKCSGLGFSGSPEKVEVGPASWERDTNRPSEPRFLASLIP